MTPKTNAHDDRAANSDDDQRPVAVPRQVHCELTTVLQMGIHDPFSEDILEQLRRYDFEATRRWAMENPEAYVAAVQRGTVDRSIVGRSPGET